MNTAARREALLEALLSAEGPVSATALATRFQVSRQSIVGDVALLRASGTPIDATARGYVVRTSPKGYVATVACNHSAAEMELELNIMVDFGCEVLDVAIEHPVYGQLTGQLHLRSRYDVSEFVRRVGEEEAKPLSALTQGIHLHTLACPNEEAYLRVCRALSHAGLLVE